MADREGFEPSDAAASTVFETAAINQTLPPIRFLGFDTKICAARGNLPYCASIVSARKQNAPGKCSANFGGSGRIRTCEGIHLAELATPCNQPDSATDPKKVSEVPIGSLIWIRTKDSKLRTWRVAATPSGNFIRCVVKLRHSGRGGSRW